MFERVLKCRKISAVVAGPRAAGAASCQVRLRPQTVNELRRNEIIFQCESCQRILYYEDPRPAPAAADRPGRDPAPARGVASRMIVHIDGGSRGNPGPAGYGVRSRAPTARSWPRFAGSIGVATNNVAEYRGLLAALR